MVPLTPSPSVTHRVVDSPFGPSSGPGETQRCLARRRRQSDETWGHGSGYVVLRCQWEPVHDPFGLVQSLDVGGT